MLSAAEQYPDVTFVACTGDQAGVAGLDNFKNIFPYTYESPLCLRRGGRHEAPGADG